MYSWLWKELLWQLWDWSNLKRLSHVLQVVLSSKLEHKTFVEHVAIVNPWLKYYMMVVEVSRGGRRGAGRRRRPVKGLGGAACAAPPTEHFTTAAPALPQPATFLARPTSLDRFVGVPLCAVAHPPTSANNTIVKHIDNIPTIIFRQLKLNLIQLYQIEWNRL